MTGRLLPFDTSTHASVDALLPFYVNATLRGEELTVVEQHVRACEKCRHEVDWLRELFAKLETDSALKDAPCGVAVTQQDLEGRPTRSDLRACIKTGLRASPPLTRWLLAAQLAAIVILGSFLAGEARDFASYRTLGAPNASGPLRDAIAVKFDPGITAYELRQIVLRVGGRIVDGPTVTDVFVLEIPQERAEEAVQALRAERAVRLAERLGPRTSR